ncbi:MAG: cohesin domain-containing protein [Thermodesulfobacteriota bacterium]
MLTHAVSARAVSLSLSDGRAEKGEQVTFSLTVDNAPATLGAFMMDIEYDPGVLRFSGFTPGESADGGYALLNAINRAPGVVRVGGVEPENPGIKRGESGVLGYITFDVVRDGNSSLTLTGLANDVEGWATRAGRFGSPAAASSSDPAEGESADAPGAKTDTRSDAEASVFPGGASGFAAAGVGFGGTGPVRDENIEPPYVPADHETPYASGPGGETALFDGAMDRHSLGVIQPGGGTGARPAAFETTGPSAQPEIGPGLSGRPGMGMLRPGGTAPRNASVLKPRFADKVGGGVTGQSVAESASRLVERAAQAVEILLLAAILTVLLKVLKEMKSQRVKVRIFSGGSSSLPEPAVSERPENHRETAEDAARVTNLEKMRLIA